MMPSKLSGRHAGSMLLSIAAIVAVLHFAEAVLVPVALAIMMAFVLAPLVGRVERYGARRGLAVALTSVVAFAVVGGLVWVVASQFLGLVEQLPSYRNNLLTKIRVVSGQAGSSGLERSVETVQELSEELQKAPPVKPGAPKVAKVQIVPPPPSVMQVVRGVFGPLVGPISTAAIVVLFVVFMLLQREDLRDRLVRLLGASEMNTTVTALDDAARRVSRYLLMQTLINSVQGALVSAGLYLIGVPDALLWGALTVVLRFIPYLGPVLAAAGPIALSLAFFAGWQEPLLVIALILTLELISNNVLEPRLYGSSVGVSSFALIVAAVFWTWLWGVAGLFLATPLTVCLAVMGRYIPRLSFFDVLLSDRAVLEPSERFYQRLLANDVDEAQDLIVAGAQSASLLEVCDTILLPALRFAEHDHERGAIDDAKRNALIDQVAELIEDLPASAADADGERPPAAATAVDPAQRLHLLCLPATDRADALAGQLLARVLPPAAYQTEAVSAELLKGEVLDHVARARPDVIFISAMPPAALAHARYLCKKLRRRFADVPIVVGLWNAQGDLQKATDRLLEVGAGKVVSSAAGALEELSRLRQPMLQGVRKKAEAPVAA